MKTQTHHVDDLTDVWAMEAAGWAVRSMTVIPATVLTDSSQPMLLVVFERDDSN